MGSGHGTIKEDKAEHPNRKVHEERWGPRERFVAEMSDKWSFDISDMSEEEFHAENARRRDSSFGLDDTPRRY